MHSQSRILWSGPTWSLWSIGADLFDDMTALVHRVYARRFSQAYGWEPQQAYAEMLAVDRDLADVSQVFAALAPDGTPLATIRSLERVDRPLPIEVDFHVDVPALMRHYGRGRAFEVARLAKDDVALAASGLRPSDGLAMTAALVRSVVQSTMRERGNVWFASLDHKVLELLRGRGFHFRALGAPVVYLGSPTVPSFLPVDACRRSIQQLYPDNYAFFFAAPAPAKAA